MQQKHIVVIGAGFSGLSAAAYLAKAGHKVTVLEKNSQAGGRAMVEKAGGFTFDLGPSWYMMPDVFEDFFAFFGKKPSDYYELTKLAPSYRVFDTKASYDVFSQADGGLDMFEKIEKGAKAKLNRLLQQTKADYKTVRGGLLELSFATNKDKRNPTALKMVANPVMLKSYHSRIRRTVKTPELQRILEFMVVFMGGSPKNIPALYSLLTYVDLGLGIWYPKGGFGAVVRGFESVGSELGVDYRYNAAVTRIESSKNKATAVWVGTQRIACDAVVASCDYQHTETTLLSTSAQTYNQCYWQSKVLSPSGFMLYLGVQKKVPNLAHHTLFFDTDWDAHFASVFGKQKKWVEKPLFYVGCPSKSDTSVAPKGSENIFVLVPTASGVQPTTDQKAKLTANIIERIEYKTATKFKDAIVVQQTRDIAYFTNELNAYKGNAFGLAHTLRQSAFLRPPIQNKKLKNLVHAGQYTNPGTGIPMVVLSGKVAARQLMEYLA